MASITEPVKIEAVIADKAPAWTVGLTGSYNSLFDFVDVCDPRNGQHQLFPGDAFTLAPTEDTGNPWMPRKEIHA
jgi:hypothetical protein